MTEEANYKILKLLEEHPGMSQRDLAREMGVSVGKVNYCLQALVEKGHIKAHNFRNSRNKAAYLYLLTPKGIRAKAGIARRYLKQKVAEYEVLQAEIEFIRRDVEAD